MIMDTLLWKKRGTPGDSPGARAAFTLIELLVVITIIGMLAALIGPAIARGLTAARATQCSGNLRQLAIAVGLYADDAKDFFPRSQHSAFSHRDIPWERSIAPYLGSSTTSWRDLLQGVYVCPSDSRAQTLGYGLNVYMELGPDDDYEGKPDTWRRRMDIPMPESTILFAENASAADHIMPNFWTSPRDAEDVDAGRHGGEANYAFVDGHVTLFEFSNTFSSAVDRWNPGKNYMLNQKQDAP